MMSISRSRIFDKAAGLHYINIAYAVNSEHPIDRLTAGAFH